MRQCPIFGVRRIGAAVRKGGEGVYLFMGNISRNIDIHDSELLTNGPIDVFHHPVDLRSKVQYFDHVSTYVICNLPPMYYEDLEWCPPRPVALIIEACN